jgi:hypothetical protein
MITFILQTGDKLNMPWLASHDSWTFVPMSVPRNRPGFASCCIHQVLETENTLKTKYLFPLQVQWKQNAKQSKKGGKNSQLESVHQTYTGEIVRLRNVTSKNLETREG